MDLASREKTRITDARGLDLRQEPLADGSVVHDAKRGSGDEVAVIDRDGGWLMPETLRPRSLTLEAYLDGLRAGRSSVTNGPLVRFTVAGAGPGDVLKQAGDVRFELHVGSALPFERAEISDAAGGAGRSTMSTGSPASHGHARLPGLASSPFMSFR